jgi:hypothetical protein
MKNKSKIYKKQLQKLLNIVLPTKLDFVDKVEVSVDIVEENFYSDPDTTEYHVYVTVFVKERLVKSEHDELSNHIDNLISYVIGDSYILSVGLNYTNLLKVK